MTTMMMIRIQIWSRRLSILQRIVSGLVFDSLDFSLRVTFFISLYISLCIWGFGLTGCVNYVGANLVCNLLLYLPEDDLVVILIGIWCGCLLEYPVWSPGLFCLIGLRILVFWGLFLQWRRSGVAWLFELEFLQEGWCFNCVWLWRKVFIQVWAFFLSPLN